MSFFQLISVQLIIFREVNVNKTRQGMPISPYPDITVLISMPVDNLLPYPATFRPINLVVVLILKSLFQILLQSLGLLSIELFFLCQEFHLFLLFVILLLFSDIVSLFLLEL